MFALIAAVGAVLTGLLGGAFRVALAEPLGWWLRLLQWVRDRGDWRLALPIIGAAMTVGLGRLVVRWSPEAAGSGWRP
jgi:hypothetical protein